MPKHYERVTLKSGWSGSIQAGERSYSTPRQDSGCKYTAVEIGYPDDADELITPYAEDPNDLTGTVYGYVPSEIVMALVMKHGGLVSGEMPPLTLTPEQAGHLAEIL